MEYPQGIQGFSLPKGSQHSSFGVCSCAWTCAGLPQEPTLHSIIIAPLQAPPLKLLQAVRLAGSCPAVQLLDRCHHLLVSGAGRASQRLDSHPAGLCPLCCRTCPECRPQPTTRWPCCMAACHAEALNFCVQHSCCGPASLCQHPCQPSCHLMSSTQLHATLQDFP